MPSPAPHTAALVLIGNELLSGKIRDRNGAFLLAQLRELGVETRRVELVPDDTEQIVDAVRRARAHAEHVFTSGGIGTTHDDVTVPAVAHALGVGVVRHPELVARLQARTTDRSDPLIWRLAEVPEGTQLLWGDAGSLRYPALLAQNVLILPGIPDLFEQKFLAIRERYRAAPILLRSIDVSAPEHTIATPLAQTQQRHPAVSIGSYPRVDEGDHSVRLTVESRNRQAVDACVADILSWLGPLALRTR